MDNIRLIAAAAALWLASLPVLAQPAVEFESRVVRVESGDTVIVERDGREVELRLADIGAPQGSQFLAPSSRSAVDGMVRNRTVRVQVTGVEEGVRLYDVSLSVRSTSRVPRCSEAMPGSAGTTRSTAN
jgi:endonuclease YncB( thermonuclease family)